MTDTTANNRYRASLILDTRGYQESVETLIEKITQSFEGLKAKVHKVINHGQKEFMRVTDRKFPAGLYIEIFCEGSGEFPQAIKERLRLDRTINRILIETA